LVIAPNQALKARPLKLALSVSELTAKLDYIDSLRALGIVLNRNLHCGIEHHEHAKSKTARADKKLWRYTN
jgi:hypothetical protein